jgi:hypothetical protein
MVFHALGDSLSPFVDLVYLDFVCLVYLDLDCENLGDSYIYSYIYLYYIHV